MWEVRIGTALALSQRRSCDVPSSLTDLFGSRTCYIPI